MIFLVMNIRKKDGLTYYLYSKQQAQKPYKLIAHIFFINMDQIIIKMQKLFYLLERQVMVE